MELSSVTMREYLKTMTKSKARTLSILGKQQNFVSAMNTEVGQQLLTDLITKHDELLSKVGDLTATDVEKAQYAFCYKLILGWSEKIDAYYRQVREIETEALKDAKRA